MLKSPLLTTCQAICACCWHPLSCHVVYLHPWKFLHVSPFPRPLVGGVSGILSRSISLMLSSSLPPNKACECCRHAIFINVTTLKSRFTFQGDFIPSSFLFFFYLVRLLTEMHLLETLSIFGRRPIRLDLTLVLCFTSAV